MQLRDYQIEIINKVYSKWNGGLQNVAVVLPTGAGKTIVITEIIKKFQENWVAIAHRSELISQLSLALARQEIYHDIIAQKATIKNIVSLHLFELKHCYYSARCVNKVIAIDTLLKKNYEWTAKVRLVVQDEAHHVLKKNKWGKAAELFKNAKGLYPTATPLRADGNGLGRNSDGVIDDLVVGASMRDLINDNYLSDYKIIAPPSDLDLSKIKISASGDYSPPQLRQAVHKSCITGDVVSHYLKFAAGKSGVTFAVDIKAAAEIARQFREAGVDAEIISSKTPPLLRAQIMKKFRDKKIMQLVNVDLLGEGVDVPAIEVVTMARPTQSYSLYVQQFGRALRTCENKKHAIIIDHVGNVLRHGLPDRFRVWSLERQERKKRQSSVDAFPLKNCLKCFQVYERCYKACPHCGHYHEPAERSSPDLVDGDLTELDEKTLKILRGEIDRVHSSVRIPTQLDDVAARGLINRHEERRAAQSKLKNSIAKWAGIQKHLKREDSEIYRRFYFNFGIDILTAQTLGRREAEELENKINANLRLGKEVGSFNRSD